MNKKAQSTGFTWFFALLVILMILVIYLLAFTVLVSKKSITPIVLNQLSFDSINEIYLTTNLLFSNKSSDVENEFFYYTLSGKSKEYLQNSFSVFIEKNINKTKLNCYLFFYGKDYIGFYGLATGNDRTAEKLVMTELTKPILLNQLILLNPYKVIYSDVERCYK